MGDPDERLGERVCVFVVADGRFDLDACRAWFAERGVARFKTPERIEPSTRCPPSPPASPTATPSAPASDRRRRQTRAAAQRRRAAPEASLPTNTRTPTTLRTKPEAPTNPSRSAAEASRAGGVPTNQRPNSNHPPNKAGGAEMQAPTRKDRGRSGRGPRRVRGPPRRRAGPSRSGRCPRRPRGTSANAQPPHRARTHRAANPA